MSQTPDQNFPIARALGRLVGVAVAFGLEYGFCYLVAVLVSNTLLHGSLDQPAAALGFMGIGNLYRWYSRQVKPKHPHLAEFHVPASTLPAGLLESLMRQGAQDAPKNTPTPYL